MSLSTICWRRCRRLSGGFIGVIVFLSLLSNGLSDLKLDHLQWRRDLLAPEAYPEFSEGPAMPKERIPIIKGGTIQVFLKNEGAVEARLKSLTLNGTLAQKAQSENQISWWRLSPCAVAQGQFGSLMIRYKETPSQKVAVVAEFSEGSKLQFEIDPTKSNADFRFESFGFSQDRSKIVVYLKKYGELAGQSVKEISYQGLPIDKPNWLTSTFSNRLAAFEFTPKELPKVGSMVYFKAKSDSGKETAYLIRVNDGFVQLGLFDEPVIADIPKLIANNQNMLTAHRHWASSQLDQIKRLGIRAGTYHLDDSATDAPVAPLNHPAYDTIYTIDEPDVWDYVYWESRSDKPTLDKRAGFYGPTVVQDLDEIRKKSGSSVQAGVVLDNTITPWNWYEYGEIADVVTHDNYVFPQGRDFSYLRHAQQAVFDAAAPVPTIHAFECCWHEINNDDPRRYNRPKTASEYRRLLLIPIGAGAKGLTGWWNVTDAAEPYTTWGAFEFADHWAVQGKTFAELSQIAPLISIGTPVEGTESNDPEIKVGTLIAGKEAVVMIPVNDSIQYSTYFSLQNPKEKVTITSPKMAWFKPTKAVAFKGFAYEEIPLKVNADETFSIELNHFIDAEVIVITSNALLPEKLRTDYQKSRGAIPGLNTQLLSEKYEQDLLKGTTLSVRRDLRLNRMDQLVETVPLEGGRPDHHPDFSNPQNAPKNAMGWFTTQDTPAQVGFKVPFLIKKGGKTLFVFQLQVKVAPIQWELRSGNTLVKEAKIVMERDYKDRWTFVTVEVPQGGRYDLVGFQTPVLNKKPPGPKYWPAGIDRPKPADDQKWEVRTGYVSRAIYVLPGIDRKGLIQNEHLDYSMIENAKIEPNLNVDRKQLRGINLAVQQYTSLFLENQIVTAEKEEGASSTTYAGFWTGNKNSNGENSYELPLCDSPEKGMGVKFPISIGKKLEGALFIQAECEKESIQFNLYEAASGKGLDVKMYSIFKKSLGENWWALKINTSTPGDYFVHLYQLGEDRERKANVSKWAMIPAESNFWESVHLLMTYSRVERAKAKLIPLRDGKEKWE